MAVLFVAASDNPYREYLMELTQRLGYAQFYPAIKHSELEDYLPLLDKKSPIVFLEATEGPSEIVPRRDAQLGVDRPVFVLRNAGVTPRLPSDDMLRQIASTMPMKEAIAFAQTNKTINRVLDWKTWHTKVSEYLDRKIPFDEFKKSGKTPLEAALRANVNFGPIRDIIDMVERIGSDFIEGNRIPDEFGDLLADWAKKPISPYLEITAIIPLLEKLAKSLEGVDVREELGIVGPFTSAIVRGIGNIEEIKDIITLAMAARKSKPIFKLVLDNPRLQKWADVLIWNGLGDMLLELTHEISELEPSDPSSRELMSWTVNTLIDQEEWQLLERFVNIVDKLDLSPASMKLFHEKVPKPVRGPKPRIVVLPGQPPMLRVQLSP